MNEEEKEELQENFLKNLERQNFLKDSTIIDKLAELNTRTESIEKRNIYENILNKIREELARNQKEGRKISKEEFINEIRMNILRENREFSRGIQLDILMRNCDKSFLAENSATNIDERSIKLLKINEEKRKEPYKYTNKYKGTTEMQQIGELNFKCNNGETVSVPQYMVVKKDLLGKVVFRREVFSDTFIEKEKLNDEEYLQALFEGLLSEKNIEESNASGYIGKVEEVLGRQDGRKAGEVPLNLTYYMGVNSIIAKGVKKYEEKLKGDNTKEER